MMLGFGLLTKAGPKEVLYRIFLVFIGFGLLTKARPKEVTS